MSTTTVHVLLVYSHDNESLVSQEKFNDVKTATVAYEQAERENRGNDRCEIVLVAADSLDTIRKTHGHYFSSSDSSLFSDLLVNQ